MKPKMKLKWHGEDAQPVTRAIAAKMIAGNRAASRGANPLRMNVRRKFGEVYIASGILNIACVIYRA